MRFARSRSTLERQLTLMVMIPVSGSHSSAELVLFLSEADHLLFFAGYWPNRAVEQSEESWHQVGEVRCNRHQARGPQTPLATPAPHCVWLRPCAPNDVVALSCGVHGPVRQYEAARS